MSYRPAFAPRTPSGTAARSSLCRDIRFLQAHALSSVSFPILAWVGRSNHYPAIIYTASEKHTLVVGPAMRCTALAQDVQTHHGSTVGSWFLGEPKAAIDYSPVQLVEIPHLRQPIPPWIPIHPWLAFGICDTARQLLRLSTRFLSDATGYTPRIRSTPVQRYRYPSSPCGLNEDDKPATSGT